MNNRLGIFFAILFMLTCLLGCFFLIRSGINSDNRVMLISGIVLTIVCWILLIGLIISSDLINLSSRAIIGLVFAGTVIILVIFFASAWWLVRSSRPPSDVLFSLSVVCRGTGVPGTGTYLAGSDDPQHIVLLDDTGTLHPWTSKANSLWRSESLNEVELVVCVSETREVVLDTCESQYGLIEMSAEQADVTIVNPSSGKPLAQQTLMASKPNCPIEGGFIKPKEWHDRLNTLNFEDLENWVVAFLAIDTSAKVANEQSSQENIPDTSQDNTQIESSEEASIENSTSELQQEEQSQPIIAYVNVSSLRVRSGPGTDFSVVAGLRRNDQITILGRNTDNSWYKVSLPDERIGWVSAEMIKLAEEELQIPLISE